MTEEHRATELSDVERLRSRVSDLERENRRLVAGLEIVSGLVGATYFVDILQWVTGGLGEMYGLDRCSIFLAERDPSVARLVASYEDPGLRDYVVDLSSYPELKRALESGETVVIPDAQSDPGLAHIRGKLQGRKVLTITVVPIRWKEVTIGAIFLRTFKDGQRFSSEDLRFTERIARLTAQALRLAHRVERLERGEGELAREGARLDRERAALMTFIARLLNRYNSRSGRHRPGVLPGATEAELDRLVEVAMTVLDEEGKGR